MQRPEIAKIIEESIRLKSDRDICLKEFDNFFLRASLWIESNLGKQSSGYEKVKEFQSELCFEQQRIGDLTKFGIYQKTIDGLIAVIESSALQSPRSDEVNLEYFAPRQIIQEVCYKFDKFVEKIKTPYRQNKKHSVDISDEYDVQHILMAILSMFFRDIS